MLNEGLRIMASTILNLSGYTFLGWSAWKVYKNFKGKNMVGKVNNYFKSINKEPIPSLIEYENREDKDFFIFNIPPGHKFSEYEKEKEGLEHVLKSEVNMWNEENRLYIRTTKQIPDYIEFDKSITNKMENNIYIPIGVNDDMIYHNLSNEYSNFLVAGTIGNGKSNYLHFVIKSMMMAYSPEQLQFNLIDLKDGVEFDEYNNSDFVNEMIDNDTDIEILIEQLKLQKKERMNKVKAVNKKKIKGMNIPYIITIIDEYAAMPEDYQEDMIYLLQQGRAAGLIFILSTQYPRNDIIDKLIAVNCDGRICFHVPENSTSQVVLNNSMACEIPSISGRAVYKYNDYHEVQIPHMKGVKV